MALPGSAVVAALQARIDRVVETLSTRQTTLWVLALVLYGVGDTLTTAIGLASGRANEAGPIAADLIGTHGIVALVGLKLLVAGGFAGVWWVVRTPSRVAIPLALAVAGGGVTAWNLAMIALG